MSLARRILSLAWPVLIGQWAALAYGVLDTVMTGHASPTDLAAVGLGSAIYVSSFIGLMGVLMALNPVIAHHYGAQHYEAIGQTWMQGVWLSCALSVLGVTALGFPDLWLMMSEVTPAVRQGVGSYLQAIAVALPAALLFRSMYAFNTAVSRPKLIMLINLLGLVCKAPLNYVLIYGKFGLPALGATGCGIATAIVMWMSVGIGFLIMRRDPFYQRFGIRFDWPKWSRQKELLRLGVPIGVSNMIEVTSFTFMALLVARLGTQVSGGHQITANLAALCFMAPLSLAIATSTLVAQALGSKDAALARRTAFTGVRLGMAGAALTSALIWFGRDTIIGWYTSDAQVAAVFAGLIPFLVLFQMFDAQQVIAGFALRAYKRTLAPLIIYTIALWGMGLCGGYWIAFHSFADHAPLGASGLWLAAGCSLAVAALTLLAYLGRVSRTSIVQTSTRIP